MPSVNCSRSTLPRAFRSSRWGARSALTGRGQRSCGGVPRGGGGHRDVTARPLGKEPYAGLGGQQPTADSHHPLHSGESSRMRARMHSTLPCQPSVCSTSGRGKPPAQSHPQALGTDQAQPLTDCHLSHLATAGGLASPARLEAELFSWPLVHGHPQRSLIVAEENTRPLLENVSDRALERDAVPIGQGFQREPPGLGTGRACARSSGRARFTRPLVKGRGPSAT